MNLYSPESVINSEMTAIISKATDITIRDNNLGVDVTRNITITFFAPFTPREDGTMKSDIDVKSVMRNITNEEVENFHLFQQIMQNCITSAEAIFRKLRNVLTSIYTVKREEVDFVDHDFMRLRDILSDLLKSEKNNERLTALFSNSNKKKFTKSFFNYITDRNIYTHGQLSIDVENKRFLVHSKVNGKESYYVVDREILQSHLNYYSFLSDQLNKISSCYN